MRPPIGQQGTLDRTLVWAKRGTRPPRRRTNNAHWAYLSASLSQRRVAAGLVMPSANAETRSLHLTAYRGPQGGGSKAHAALVLDNRC